MAHTEEQGKTKISEKQLLEKVNDFDRELRENLSSISFLEKIERKAIQVSQMSVEDMLRIITV